MATGQFHHLNRITPTCTARYSDLVTPKGYKGDENDRCWSIQVRMSPTQGEEFIKEVEEIALKLQEVEKANMAQRGKKMRDGAPFISFKVNADGEYVINFKKKEKAGSPPPVVDYNRVPIQGKIPIGTRIQVAYNLAPYVIPGTGMFGLSFQLIAVRTMEQDLPSEELQALFSASKEAAVLSPSAPTAPVDLDALF